jgi:hypothetical protein
VGFAAFGSLGEWDYHQGMHIISSLKAVIYETCCDMEIHDLVYQPWADER